MTPTEFIKKAIHLLDDYMIRSGKDEINEMEANQELAKVGMLEDEVSHPGKPLRELLIKLRDSNHLPQNIRQRYGAWKIRISSTVARKPMVISVF
ncbi:MAG TPA: hypothetical protein DEQ27_08105 [Prevotella sp.]|nr:hypothetical protein [Prevotella sp.]